MATGAGTRWYRKLYVWVLIGILAGIVVGAAWPGVGAGLEPLGTVFVDMITMVVGPIIFVTVVGGIAGVDDLRKVGRIGVKSLIYFEGMTTVALVLGLVAIDVLHPGTAIHADPARATDLLTRLARSRGHFPVDNRS